jgi:hypothetical protein
LDYLKLTAPAKLVRWRCGPGAAVFQRLGYYEAPEWSGERLIVAARAAADATLGMARGEAQARQRAAIPPVQIPRLNDQLARQPVLLESEI